MSKPHAKSDRECLNLPRFERVKYFYGQLLGVREFQSEQSYFLEKHRLHNRYLHGYGVVCGLGVRKCDPPEPPCPEPAQDKPQSCIEIDCGLAIDCAGNEIAVSWPVQIDVLDKLDCDERKRALAGDPVYVSLVFVEQPLEPVRPLTADGCGGLVADCVPSRLRDDFCVRLSLERPEHDRACGACERPCCDPQLPLAVVRWKDGALHVDDSIRRPLGAYEPTRVVGVSWVHDGTYEPGDVDEMLGDGLVIHFSDDVYTSTLRRGVLDVWIIQGGGGRRGDIYSVDVRLVPSSQDTYSRSVRAVVPHRQRDHVDPGDRVLIQLRSAFVLDRCCRPVDGDHAGGLVPVLDAYRHRWRSKADPIAPPCVRPDPLRRARWSSGNGTAAGNFESWFYVADRHDHDRDHDDHDRDHDHRERDHDRDHDRDYDRDHDHHDRPGRKA